MRKGHTVCQRLWLSMFLAVLLPTAGTAAEPSEARVAQFSPQGTVKKVRQATARFSEPMVPLGDPRPAADPFAIECPEAGRGRWVDSRNWAYDFNRDLPAGVRCTFRMRTGLTSLAGKPLAGERAFGFSTGGPAIQTSSPSAGMKSIEEEQAFVLILDAEPSEASLHQHVWFVVDGIPQRVGIRLISGEARAAILKTFYRGFLSGPAVVLQAKQRFPNSAAVHLIWGKGVTSATGVATDQEQVLEFKTRKPFTARVHCERPNRQTGCVPLTPITVRFSASVPWEQARQSAVIGPDGRRWSPDAVDALEQFVDRLVFKGPFPESATLQVEVPTDLHDDAGRALANGEQFPVSVKTDTFPPLAKFSSRFGILEAHAAPALPVTVRNVEADLQARVLPITREHGQGIAEKMQDLLGPITGNVARIPPDHLEQILPWLRKVAAAKRDTSVFAGQPAEQPAQPITLPKPTGPNALEVIGIPFEAPGLYIVELASPCLGAALLGKEQPLYVPAAALVTNLSVHFKWGRENALAWVTTLDKARPVAGAHVTVQNCQGAVLWRGDTDRSGIARIDGLPGREELTNCNDPTTSAAYNALDYRDRAQTPALDSLNGGLLVTAQTADDLSFVHSSWNQGIESWRFQLPSESWRGPLVAHTIFDRTLLRAGDTVHMKHLLRKQSLQGFAVVPENERPTVASIEHLGSQEKYELPLQWDAAGIAESTWDIPKEAKLGRYQVVLRRESARPWRDRWESGSFRVEQFRVPLMKGTVKLPAEPQIAVSDVPVDLSAQYLTGGPARKQPVVLRAQIRPKALPSIDEFERFTFANGAVKEGIERRGVNEDEGADESAAPAEKKGVHQRQDLVLDDAGAARTTITNLPQATTVRELLTEMEFRDPNGEAQTVSSTVPLWPAKWLVGIKTEFWVATERVSAKIGVVDTAQRPVSGAPVRVRLYEHKTYSHRKRLVGGFYAYENIEETWPAGELCTGRTDAHGLLQCEGKPPTDGNLIVEASVSDDAGHASTANAELWIAGAHDWWFPAQDSDRIDLLPEQPRYEPGETARLQVRMPFREATALVSVEREGILTASVVALSGKEPVVEVPVNPAYAPNVFVSVLAVRGRVGDVQPTAMVDLGRPAFKLGIAEIRVGWRAHELKVSVTADRPTYKVRETAVVKIAVVAADGGVPPPGGEVAVAAVDEGLLELMPNKSWELLEAMMSRRGYGVASATAQMQVVGKRHFGLKALPQGGGGGRQTTRELFDTLLMWKGRVALDGAGAATVDVPLNDSLTSFRIVAVATAGVDRFGSGATSIRSTQDLMLLSAIPPVVREGDRFRSEFTVRNTMARTLDVLVSGRVRGLAQPLETHAVNLVPGEAKVTGWPITVPTGVDALVYEVEAQQPGGPSDRVRVTQQVRAVVPVRTYQATLSRWEAPELRQPVERPADAIPARGGVQITLAPTLTAGLAGVRQWMETYPYTCLEQRVSRAVALGDAAMWQDVAAALPSYVDTDGLLKYFPSLGLGSEVLTAYVLAVSHEAGFVLPREVQDQMESGLGKFVDGSIARDSEVHTADLSIRKLAAIEALARVGKARPPLLGSISIEPNLWPTSAVLDWWSILRRVPGIRDREARIHEAAQIVRARLNLQGTTMGFSSEQSDELWWLMVNPDANAARLILQLLDTKPPAANDWADDLPRIVRGAFGRQSQGTWASTVANAWGALAVRRFASAFEKTPVTGTTTAALGAATQSFVWSTPPKEATLLFPWPTAGEDLRLHHAGAGNPWVTVAARAAIPLRAPLSSGYEIEKTVTPIEARQPGRFSRGDLLRVRLHIKAQSDMTWVVVSDPIPAGASHLGTGLARDSQIAAAAVRQEEAIFPAFEERAADAFRAYYEFVPKGSFVTEYTLRLNHAGRFNLPTTRVEALYAPEMFGEVPNAAMEVQE